MKHLTSQQLSAHLDGALSGSAAEEAERHLAECQDCRDALAALAAQDDQLRPMLSHDPGDAYFEELPSRVSARILTREMTEPREPFSFSRLFQSPRSLAWVGSAAVLVVGAAVVLMTANQVESPDLHDRDLMARSERGQEHAAAPNEAAPESRLAQRPAPSSAEQNKETARARQDKSASATVPAPAAAKKAAPADDRRAPSNEGFAAPPPPVSGSRTATTAKAADGRDAGASTGDEAKRQSAAAPKPQAAAPAQPKNQASARGGVTDARHNQAAEPAPTAAKASPPAKQAEKDKQDQDRKQATPPPQETRYREETAKLGATKTESGGKALAPPAASPAPPAAQSLAPSASAGSAADAAAPRETRLCGEVRDGEGRPVAGASVEITLQRVGTTTDLRGGFCIDVPPGDHRVTFMAVGFSSTTQTLHAGDKAKITLGTVPVLTKPLEPVRTAPSAGSSAPLPPLAPKGDPYVTLPESQRSVVRAAQQSEANAQAQRDTKAAAKLYDDAANGWQKALKSLTGQPLELETRWRMAEARFNAWERDPNSKRESAAVEALTAYAGRAPGGSQRDRATRMLDRIQH